MTNCHADMSTADLVEAIKAGDREAFAVLYRQHVGVVHLAVRDQLRDPERVADTVQETFARALASLDRLRDPERFRPWLLSIARHTAIDARRDQTRFVLDDPEEQPTGERDDPAELAALRDIAGLVDGVVGGLSRRDAVALRLITLGFDIAGVAAVLDVKHGAAKVALHRARRRLRAALVLQLLASGAATSCAELPKILDTEGLVCAGRHAETCRECEDSARRAVYGG